MDGVADGKEGRALSADKPKTLDEAERLLERQRVRWLLAEAVCRAANRMIGTVMVLAPELRQTPTCVTFEGDAVLRLQRALARWEKRDG